MQLSRRDEGLSLIEVLLVIVILGLITVPLGNAFIDFLNNTDRTTQRLSESHDLQLAAAYFAQDVQSVGTRDWSTYPYELQQSVELNAPAAAGLYPCGLPGQPDAVVRLAWDDPQDASGTPSVVRVAYVVIDTGVERQLHRVACNGSATPVSDIVVAHNLDTVAPAVACSTSCTAAPAVPQTITLTLTIRSAGNSGPALVASLIGQRRQT
jgi:prepilin-type N-terminal cleavage/methylation domain-containing protein